MYGAIESNPITPEIHEFRDEISETVDLADKRLDRIVRLRLLTDRGFPFWDVSYCYGVLKDGTKVRVNLPQHQFPRATLKGSLIEMCKREGVFAKGLGLLDENVWSRLQ